MPSELTERQKTILDAVIREYVATAEPVASADIVRRYRLPYSPATVRNELLALDEVGYLAQPHTSAGRLPTDKGYRYYINSLERGRVNEREERLLSEVRELNDPAEFLRQSSHWLATLTHNFVLAGFPEDDVYCKAGLGEVMAAPEFSNLELMQGFGALVDHVEEDFQHWLDQADDLAEPLAFVGVENPIRLARRYSMIVSACETPFEKEGVVALFGPKRMDYAHNLAVLKHFRDILAR